MNETGNNTESRTAVRLSCIHKRFGNVKANIDVSLQVARASIHGLVGENGAGKSTLMLILYGFYTADKGSIEIEGRPALIKNSHEAIALGIGMVHQHFMLVDKLSALDNVILGAESSILLVRAQEDARKKLQALMRDTGLVIDLDKRVEDLSVGDRQRLEILKALHRGARILILDEPTAVLTAQETEQLFVVLRRLRESGKTIILITHKLKEVLALCDQVTVMRAGEVVMECAAREASIPMLAEAMVGRQLKMPAVRTQTNAEMPVRLEVNQLNFRDEYGVHRLRGVSFKLQSGEIVGIAGVAGNGQSQLLEILSGIQVPTSGEMTALGHHFKASAGGHWLDPETARRIGMAHVPEDRHERGLVLQFGAWESVALGYERLPAFCRRFFLRSEAMLSHAQSLMHSFDVRPPHPRLRSSKFSGGNQQKLILARELSQAPKILLVGQPTRGVDIGAIEFIHDQLRSLRDRGCAIVLVSTELEEILALSDRVMVMNQGQITGELPAQACDEKKIGLLMVSQHDCARAPLEPKA